MITMTMARALLGIAAAAGFGAAPAWSAPDPAGAAAIFAQAKAISDRDGGRFWGRPFYGPMILVDSTDQHAVANAADGAGVLHPSGGLYAGVLPADVTVSSTPIEWAGKRWTELLWPLEPKGDAHAAVGDDWRRVLLAHEMFHRIQPGLGLTRPEVASVHLDTLQGRYLLQLEWRALARALTAATPDARRAATAQALLFRSERYRLFPAAGAAELTLEIDEGIAEYTGVRVGLETPAAQTRYAVYDLSAFVDAPSYVRAFPYATGPAYGLLLDAADPAWRGKLGSGRRLDDLLASALKLSVSDGPGLAAAEAEYDPGGRLHAAEVARDRGRQALLATLKARLVDGPVLRLALHHADYAFNPQTLQPLDGAGVVYPTLKLNDDWGRLQVDRGGALLDRDMTRAAVSLAGADPSHLAGDGWRLTLKPGWTITPGARKGDLGLTPPAGAPTGPAGPQGHVRRP